MNMFDLDEIEELLEELTSASIGYYSGKPIMSDQVYDAKEIRLRELDPENDYFNKVGSEIPLESTFAKVDHDVLMLSLDKAYSLEEVISCTTIKGIGIGMPKMDGFALSLKYVRKNSSYILKQAITRGKGDKGSDVTENARQVIDIPSVIPTSSVEYDTDEFEIRGEVYMKRSVLMQHISEGQKFENCRNIAPGSMSLKDPLETKSRRLNFFAYNVIGISFTTMTQKFTFLEAVGIPSVECIMLDLENSVELNNVYNHYRDNRDSYDFDIDGVVFMINDCKIFNELGNTSHHPRGAIAWKFESEQGETTLNDIVLQVSRTGLVNPVGIYEPIYLDGATLTNATLHNLSIIEKLNLGIGDKIIVSRRGGVIPKIESVTVSSGNPFKIPTQCPVCSADLVIHISDDGVKTLHCESLDCPAQVLTGILHFISVMEIMDVGSSLVSKLIEAGYIETYADLFKVTYDNLISLESVKDRTAKRTLDNIALSKQKPLGVFLASLGIPNLGRSISESVANHFETIEAVLSATASDFACIDGVGDIMSVSIERGLKSKSELISELRDHINIIGLEPKVSGGILSGKSFLITGTLSDSRGYFEKIIKENGGVIKSSVSKTLDYLLLGDNPGSKLSKAKKAGVTIIQENEFMCMLNYKD